MPPGTNVTLSLSRNTFTDFLKHYTKPFGFISITVKSSLLTLAPPGRFWLEGVVLVAIAAIGLVGNVLTGVVLKSFDERNQPFNNLVSAVQDLLEKLTNEELSETVALLEKEHFVIFLSFTSRITFSWFDMSWYSHKSYMKGRRQTRQTPYGNGVIQITDDTVWRGLFCFGELCFLVSSFPVLSLYIQTKSDVRARSTTSIHTKFHSA